MKKLVIFVTLSLIFSLFLISAEIPQKLNVHGRLTNSTGSALSGAHNIAFQIYNVYSGGVSLWNSGSLSVTSSSDGIYDVILNTTGLNFNEQYYLGITVGADSEMTPRINLTSSPYSFRANVTDTLNSSSNYEMQNLTLGQKITFAFGEIIDNIIDGMIRITGHMDVTGDVISNGNNLTNAYLYSTNGTYYLSSNPSGYIAWANAVNGTLFTTALYNANYSLNDEAYRSITNTSYYLETNPFAFYNSTTLPGGTSYWNLSGSSLIPSSPSYNVNITTNLTLGNGTIMFNDTTKSYYYYNGSVWRAMSGGVPAGAVMAFNSATCPVGWVAADGTGGTPDLRGLFIRGAGVSGSYTMANGTAFQAVFGTQRSDLFQSHKHDLTNNVIKAVGTHLNPFGAAEIYWGDAVVSDTNVPKSAGAATGTPRVGGETAPASYALTYCVKTTEDDYTSNSIWGESGNNVILQNTSKNLVINNTNLVVNTSSGNVGIGTASPTVKLDIYSATGTGNLGLKSGTGDFWYVGPNSGGGTGDDTFSIYSATYGVGHAYAPIMTLLNNSNVGIGTTSPDSSLYGTHGLAIYNNVAKDPSIALNNSIGNWLMYMPSASNDLAFYNGATRMFIEGTNGNVGIGTTNPLTKLNVRYGVSANFIVRNGSDFGAGYSGVAIDSVNDAFVVRNMMVIAGNPVVFPTVGGYVNVEDYLKVQHGGTDANRYTVYWNSVAGDLIFVSSDERLKENINYNDVGGIDTIMKLKPATFNFKNNTEKLSGFMAQNTLEVDSTLAWHNETTDQWGLNGWDGFAAISVKAIQEQQKVIEQQNNTINDLKQALCEIKPELELCK